MLFIFDMGGVVTDNVNILAALCAKLNISEKQFARFNAECDIPGNNRLSVQEDSSASPYTGGALAALQSGTLSAADFWKSLAAYFRLPFIPPDYIRFCFQPVRNEPVYHLIERLRKNHRVVCGTNTLESHYQVHLERGDYTCFDKVYASHLMGCIKPQPAFWQFILEMEKTVPENAVFFDDNVDNVGAATALGIQAHLFTDADSAEHVCSPWLG